MVSITDVKAEELIEKVSEKLKSNKEIKPPLWADFVKTGPHAERRPAKADWWYVRCASLLRKISTEGRAIGVGELRTWYGGRKNRGSKPEHHVDASGSIIRKALQQLEKAGYIKKEKKGRKVSPAGQSLLTKTVLEIKGGKKVERREGEKEPGNNGITSAKGKAVAPKRNPRTKSKAKVVKHKTSKP